MKEKGIALVLAIIFSFWTWAYTFQKDKTKLYTALGIHGAMVIFDICTLGFGIFFHILVACGITLWAIIDVVSKDAKWYKTA